MKYRLYSEGEGYYSLDEHIDRMNRYTVVVDLDPAEYARINELNAQYAEEMTRLGNLFWKERQKKNEG